MSGVHLYSRGRWVPFLLLSTSEGAVGIDPLLRLSEGEGRRFPFVKFEGVRMACRRVPRRSGAVPEGRCWRGSGAAEAPARSACEAAPLARCLQGRATPRRRFPRARRGADGSRCSASRAGVSSAPLWVGSLVEVIRSKWEGEVLGLSS